MTHSKHVVDGRLKIIGTSHISSDSVTQIKKYIEENKPDIVAVELDKRRLMALMQDQKSEFSFRQIRQLGLSGFLFAAIGQYVQKKLGDKVNVKPGSDMLAAVRSAKKNGSLVALIDQDVEITLKNIKFRFKEISNFFIDAVRGLIMPKREIKKLGLEGMDLSKVPAMEVIEKLIERVKDRYPRVYKALIADRDKYMAKRVNFLLLQHPDKKILVVIGAGHKGMNELIDKSLI